MPARRLWVRQSSPSPTPALPDKAPTAVAAVKHGALNGKGGYPGLVDVAAHFNIPHPETQTVHCASTGT